ncbi:Cupin-5 domain-containing protein [Fusarium keratoplasticum]|nr:Cupin-5 domain-containing protein [Fusarium keratoplasticum]
MRGDHYLPPQQFLLLQNHSTDKMGEYIPEEPDLGALKPSFTGSPEPETPGTNALIRTLSLIPHMEGGYFQQTDEDPTTIPSPYPSEALSAQTTALAGPPREGFDINTRRLSTTIFYLLTPRRPQGNFHRNRSRVIHTLHRGRGRYVLIHPGGRVEAFIVGHAVEQGERIQWVVEGNVWKASYLLPSKATAGETQHGEGLLISETVVPGFEYCDHEFLSKQAMKRLLPEDQARELDWLVRESDDKPQNSTDPELPVSSDEGTRIAESIPEIKSMAPDGHGVEPLSVGSA